MKTTIILLLCVAILNAELTSKERKQIALTCIKQVGIRAQVIYAAMAGNLPEDDVKYKDFLACSYKKHGFQSETGEILLDNIKRLLQKYLKREDLKQIDHCGGHDGSNHGENAFAAAKCVIQELMTMKYLQNNSPNNTIVDK